MSLRVQVVDVATGSALPAATVSINNIPRLQTDANGYVTIDADGADDIGFSYVGFDPYTVQYGILAEGGQVQISRHGSTLPAVTVTPNAGTSSNKIATLGIAGLVAIALLSSDKKRSVGKVDNTAMYVGIGALAIGGVYLLTRPKSQQSGSTPVYQYPTPAQGSGGASQWITAGLGILSDLFGNIFSGSGSPKANLPAVEYPGGTAGSPASNYPTVDPNGGIDFSDWWR